MTIARETLEELYSKLRLSQRAVARKLGIPYTTLRNYLKKYGVATLERDVFQWNEDTSYLVGALLGDGCAFRSYGGHSPLRYRVELAVSDEIFARRVFNSALRIGLCPHWYKPQTFKNSIKTYTCYKVGIDSEKLYQLIINLKLEPIKLLDLIQNSKEASYLLAGFYDAEGCYVNKNSRWYHLQMSNTNIPLLSTLKLVSEKIGYDFRLRLVRKAQGNWKPLYRLVSTKRSEIYSFLGQVTEIRGSLQE